MGFYNRIWNINSIWIGLCSSMVGMKIWVKVFYDGLYGNWNIKRESKDMDKVLILSQERFEIILPKIDEFISFISMTGDCFR
jgi:hypothetical protein